MGTFKRLRNGVESDTYWYKFTFQGRQYLRRTPETTKAAAEKLEAQHLQLLQRGLFADAEKIRLRRATVTTIGDIIAAYRLHAPLQRKAAAPGTIAENINCLRRLIRSVHFPDAEDPTEQIDALPATILTGHLIASYKNLRLKAAGDDEIARDRARTTCNSTIRQARSVIGKKIAPSYTKDKESAGAAGAVASGAATAQALKLPDLDSFWNAPLFEEPDHTFEPIPQALIDALWTASKALKIAPEGETAEQRTIRENNYRIWLMSTCCGLRQKEQVYLRRSEILHKSDPSGRADLPVRHYIPLRNRRGFTTKNKKPRHVPMEDSVWRELESLNPIVALPAPDLLDPAGAAMVATTQSDWILHGTESMRYKAFRHFGAWLKSHGWTRQKKAHELRKYFGSIAADQHGDRIAPKLLGNTPKVFQAHYDALHDIPEVKIYKA